MNKTERKKEMSKKAICKDHACEYERRICCRDCELAVTCDEVCDGMDAEGLQKPCDWRVEE